MSLTLEYFIGREYDKVHAQRAELERLLLNNNAACCRDEWARILTRQKERFDILFNKPIFLRLQKMLAQSTKSHSADIGNVYKQVQPLIRWLGGHMFFELKIIGAVIDFAAACSSLEEMNRIWDLPPIDADLDYKQSKYSPFMPEGDEERLARCRAIKNANPIFSDCYVMVTNHYDMEVGLLDISSELKSEITDIIPKAKRFLPPSLQPALPDTVATIRYYLSDSGVKMSESFDIFFSDMPNDIKDMITIDLLKALRIELSKNVDYCPLDKPFDDDAACVQSTSSWHRAFEQACISENKQALFEYYKTLDWDESDCFDAVLCDIIILNEPYQFH